MVNTEIKIVDFKDTSNVRTSFDTENHGKMSAFRNGTDTLIEDLKRSANKYVIVDVDKNVKDDKIYYNIRKFVGLASDEKADYQDKMTDDSFKGQSIAISRENEKKSSNGRKEYDKDPVGLAVEIFCAAYSKEIVVREQMALAIESVKQAQKAFS